MQIRGTGSSSFARSSRWARLRRQKGREGPPPFCVQSKRRAVLSVPQPLPPPGPAAAAAMLSARVASALARSLPRQAGLVSAMPAPESAGPGGRGAAAILGAAVTLRVCVGGVISECGEGSTGCPLRTVGQTPLRNGVFLLGLRVVAGSCKGKVKVVGVRCEGVEVFIPCLWGNGGWKEP